MKLHRAIQNMEPLLARTTVQTSAIKIIITQNIVLCFILKFFQFIKQKGVKIKNAKSVLISRERIANQYGVPPPRPEPKMYILEYCIENDIIVWMNDTR